MLTAQPTAESPLVLPGRTAIVWLMIAVLTTAFYFIEHTNARFSQLDELGITGDEMAVRASEGDAARRVAILAIGLFGAMLLVRRDGWRLELRSWLGWLLLGYLVWCALSVFWSLNLALTVRHVGVLLFCAVGALGVARQVTLRELCLITLVVTTILVTNSVRTEIAMGTFRPLDPQYRFAGTLHPNVQAPYCALMALAAACLASRAGRWRMFLWALCLTAVALLLLTKSRTVCGVFLVGLLVYGSFGVSWPKRIMAGTAILWVGCALAFVSLLLGWGVKRQAVALALVNREAEAGSLSGRVPLWADLMSHVQVRPLLGHGYQTFWDPQRIGDFSHSLQWTITDGHSAYLDTLLDLGIIGAALFLMAIVTGIREVGHRFLYIGGIGYAFLFALLACRALNALMESGFSTTTNFVTFIMVCGLMHLAYCRTPSGFSSFAASPKEMGG